MFANCFKVCLQQIELVETGDGDKKHLCVAHTSSRQYYKPIIGRVDAGTM